MKVNLAKNCGFCGGVHRAYAIVKKEFKGKSFKNRILILGSLVHNENVMGTVKQWGIEKIKTLKSVKAGDVVIITAHGVGKDVMKQVVAKGCKLFDTTCPKVSIIHKKVEQHHKKGFEVVIFGDNKHNEVRGINGWCENRAHVVGNLNEAKVLVKRWQGAKDKKSIIVVSQTTQSTEKYRRVCEVLFSGAEKAGRKIISIDTICDATSLRQREAKEAAQANDAVIVVGGKKSANTRRLWNIARSINPWSVWIDDLHRETMSKIRKITKKAKTVAVISGASTPIWDIRKVEMFLQKEGLNSKNKR